MNHCIKLLSSCILLPWKKKKSTQKTTSTVTDTSHQTQVAESHVEITVTAAAKDTRALDIPMQNSSERLQSSAVTALSLSVNLLHEKAGPLGIDKYDSLPNLTGAVNDAKAMETFLKLHLNVPADRIRMLLDHEASRKEIIEALQKLSQEDAIEVNDPILIYYAGHGTQMNPPLFWEAGGAERKIQAICPCDYESGGVHVIPDRTLGAYLALICEKKGNNITVIFDCCHSSSGTRVGVPRTDIRGVVLDNQDLPATLDWAELPVSTHRGSRNATKFGVHGLATHVLIAACKERETAKEENGRGRFTHALLELFQEENKLKNLTYTDILKCIKPIHSQNPQVEGLHRDRIVFTANDAQRRSLHHVIQPPPQGGNYYLDVGSIHGIIVGSQFSIYKDQESFLASSPLAMLAVSSVMPFKSVLRPLSEDSGDTINLHTEGIAILSFGGEGQALHISLSCKPTKLPPALIQSIQLLEAKNIISLKSSNDGEGTLELQLENDRIVINIIDPSVTACGLYRVYHSIKSTATTGAVAGILSAGGDFFWHLGRNSYHPILKSIKIEFFELTPSDELDATGRRVLISNEDNLLKDGSIDIYVGTSPKAYGIKITNNSQWDLFPAAFYFDHSDWSIESYYHPGTAGQFEADPPLLRNGGTLTIGYGAGGSDPISFRFNHTDQDLDVGHLKIFFSTKEVDIRQIIQDSPFTGNRRASNGVLPELLDGWATVQYPIIQRREVCHVEPGMNWHQSIMSADSMDC